MAFINCPLLVSFISETYITANYVVRLIHFSGFWRSRVISFMGVGNLSSEVCV